MKRNHEWKFGDEGNAVVHDSDGFGVDWQVVHAESRGLDEIFAVELLVLSDRIDALGRENASLKTQNAALEEECRQVNAALEARGDRISACAGKIADLKRELAQEKATAAHWKAQAEEKEPKVDLDFAAFATEVSRFPRKMARLARLDALLASEEAPEGLADLLGAVPGMPKLLASEIAWRWFREALGEKAEPKRCCAAAGCSPECRYPCECDECRAAYAAGSPIPPGVVIDDPVAEKEPDPALVERFHNEMAEKGMLPPMATVQGTGEPSYWRKDGFQPLPPAAVEGVRAVAPGPFCENGLPDCGPANRLTDDDVRLCERCYLGLAEEAGLDIMPLPIDDDGEPDWRAEAKRLGREVAELRNDLASKAQLVELQEENGRQLRFSVKQTNAANDRLRADLKEAAQQVLDLRKDLRNAIRTGEELAADRDSWKRTAEEHYAEVKRLRDPEPLIVGGEQISPGMTGPGSEGLDSTLPGLLDGNPLDR